MDNVPELAIVPKPVDLVNELSENGYIASPELALDYVRTTYGNPEITADPSDQPLNDELYWGGCLTRALVHHLKAMGGAGGMQFTVVDRDGQPWTIAVTQKAPVSDSSML